MAINFPDTKNPNDTFSVGDKTWIWDGTTWKIYSSTTSGISLSDLSVSTSSVGTSALSYNNTTGVFTYTPPDLSAVQSDWNATTGLKQILNKPTIPPAYTLPTASTTVLGGVKVDGSTITIANGVISGANTYSLPTATTTVLGGVKIDGSTITINNGVITASSSSTTNNLNLTDESGDTECFPVFCGAATNNQTPHTNTSLKFNATSGQLQASSFKKIGGSSSEFLKADGSIDSSTYSTFSGSYTDLTNKPTIFSGSYTDLTNKPTLFSGSYTDLTNKPTIPTATSQLTNDSGFITSGGGGGRVYLLDDQSISNWGSTYTLTGIPTGGAGGTTPYKRITILFDGVAITNPGSGQVRIRLGTSNNGIDSSTYSSASTDGQGNTYTDSTGFIIGKTVSRGAAPLLSGSIVLDRSGGGASGGSFGTIVQTHTILEHGTGTDHVYSGAGLKEFQADNFDRIEFSIDNSQTGGNNVNLTGSFFFGNVSVYVEF